MQRGTLSRVDDAHTAATQLFQDSIVGDDFANPGEGTTFERPC